MATTYTITVQSTGNGNKFFVDGVQQDSLIIDAGETYIFDQSDASNSGHPLALSRTDNGTHGGGVAYTNGVVVTGTAGTDRVLTFTAPNNAPSSLYYYCQVHSGMGSDITVVGQSNNDPIRNFFKTLIVGQYSTTDIELDIINTDAPKLPDPAVDGAYNLTIFTGSDSAESEFFEIVRVYGKSGNTLTVYRAQEGTDPLDMSNPADTFGVVYSATKKTFDDIKAEIDQAQLDVQSLQDELDSFAIADQDLNTTDDVTFDSVTTTSRFQLPSIAGFPSNPQIGDLFINSLTNELVVFNGSAFQRVAGDLVALLEKANATASIPQLDLGLEVLQPNATASSNLANMIALSQAQRLLELAEASTQGVDAEAVIIIPAGWSTTSSMQRVNRGQGSGDARADSAISAGGVETSGYDNHTDVYNGTSWSTTTNLNYGSLNSPQTVGTHTDALNFSGWNGSSYLSRTEKWNGASWSNTSGRNNADYRGGSVGDSTQALGFQGRNGFSGGPQRWCEIWNGSTWANTSNTNYARQTGFSMGLSNTDALIGGGVIYQGGTHDQCEKWNGSSWSTTTSLPQDVTGAEGGGVPSKGYVWGFDYNQQVYSWNGSSWSTAQSYPVSAVGVGGGGTSTNGVSFSGYDGNNGITSTFTYFDL